MASPILTLESKGKPHTIKVNLDGNTARDLRIYAVYANGSEDSVVPESLLNIFNTDSGFADWKNNPENLLKNTRKTRRSAQSLTQPHGVAEAAKVGK